MDATDIAFAGAAEQARMLAAGAITAPALLELYLDRIARVDRELRGVNLGWANLAGVDLSGADLTARTCAAPTSPAPISPARSCRTPSWIGQLCRGRSCWTPIWMGHHWQTPTSVGQ